MMIVWWSWHCWLYHKCYTIGWIEWCHWQWLWRTHSHPPSSCYIHTMSWYDAWDKWWDSPVSRCQPSPLPLFFWLWKCSRLACAWPLMLCSEVILAGHFTSLLAGQLIITGQWPRELNLLFITNIIRINFQILHKIYVFSKLKHLTGLSNPPKGVKS